VIVVEGEKCADAAAKIFPHSIVTTSPNGAVAAHKADWSPLRGRNVLLWPDNDEPGRSYMGAVAAELVPLGCHVRQVDAARLAEEFAEEGKTDKWDCADGLKRFTPEALREAAVESMTEPGPAPSDPAGARADPQADEVEEPTGSEPSGGVPPTSS
jgi:DNA primase